MHGSILALTVHPGTPLGKASPSGPGMGEFFQVVLSQRGGGRANRNNDLSKELLGYTMARNFMDESTYFFGKWIEFVNKWLEKNSLSYIIYEGVKILLNTIPVS